MAGDQPSANLAVKIADKRAGRSIRAVAQEIGISPATLSRVENGNVPDLETFRKICSWLNEDPAVILGMSASTPSPLEVRVHFKKDQALNPTTAKALADMILHAQKAMQDAEEL